MSNSGKIIIAVLVVIIVIVLGSIWYSNSKVVVPNADDAMNDIKIMATTTQMNDVKAPAPLDTSDTSIQSDIDSADAQINNLNTDYSNININ